MLIEPKCDICKEPSARIEILAPGEMPSRIDEWEPKWRELFLKHRHPGKWRMLFSSLGGGNGVTGDAISEEKAALWQETLSDPITFERVRTLRIYDDLGFCRECKVPYCDTHWAVSSTGFGRCPKGHGRSLDPHWSPD